MELYVIIGLIVVGIVFYLIYKIKYARNFDKVEYTNNDNDNDEEENNEYDWYLEEDLY